MSKRLGVCRKAIPLILGLVFTIAGTHTAIADHKPNHVTNPKSLAMMIVATFSADCRSVTASSEKDLSNVVLLFTDRTWEKFDDLDVPQGEFSGTGDNIGKTIESAYIKSGSFKQPVGLLDPESGKENMIKVGETFTCESGSLS